MPKWTQAGDLTTNNLPFLGGAGTQAYRVSNAINTYYPGTVLVLSAVDSEILPDFQTVQASPATANTAPIAGVVADSWGGFDNAGIFATSFTSVATQLNVAGTQFVQAKIKGVNYVFINAASGTNILNGTALCTSANTVGYAQGISSTACAPNICVGAVNIPTTAANYGGTITSAALVQASGTITVAGTPATGDVLSAFFQIPYTDLQPGTVQYGSVSVTLTASQATSVTTAALALLTAMNQSPYFATGTTFGQRVQGVFPYYAPATQVAGAITIKVNTLANPFLVTGGATNLAGRAVEQWRFEPSLSGQLGNENYYYGSVSAGSGSSITPNGLANTTQLASGAGFNGRLPATIYGQY